MSAADTQKSTRWRRSRQASRHRLEAGALSSTLSTTATGVCETSATKWVWPGRGVLAVASSEGRL